MDNNNSSSKTKTVVTIFVVVVVVIAGVLGFLFYKKTLPLPGLITGTASFQTEPSSTGGSVEDNASIENLPPPQSGGEENTPLFFKITDGPVAGAVALPGGNTVRFAKKEDGHIFDAPSVGGELTPVANRTIPRLHEALFSSSGKSVLYRYVEQDGVFQYIKTYLGDLDSSSATGVVGGRFLPDNINDVSYLPDSNTLAYIQKTDDGSIISEIDLATKTVKGILNSQFGEWIPYLTTKGLLLATKPSSRVAGYFYYYEPNSRSYERLARNKNGLTVLPTSSGKKYLYSENTATGLVLGIRGLGISLGEDTQNDSRDDVVLPLSTLTDKCVWSHDTVEVYCATFASGSKDDLPDSWYRGELLTSDIFWKLNTDTGETTLVGDPALTGIGRTFDATTLFLSPDENKLYFIDKHDGSLWGIDLTHNTKTDSRGSSDQ